MIGTNIGRSFIIGCRGKSQRTRRGIYGELGRISAATDRVASGLTGIRIGRRNRGHRGGVLGNRDRRRGPTLVGGDHRRLVLIANRHRDRLGVNSAVAIRDLHRDVVDVVRAFVGGRFEVGGRDKSQRTRRGIDGELGRSVPPLIE